MKDLLKRILRHLAIGTIIGLVAGVIAGGLGSRLAMRITALMTEAAMQGRLTEAQARVGEITLGGTFFLIFFSAIFGIYSGLIYRVLVAQIPAKTLYKGLGFGIFLLLLHGTVIIEGGNFDFTRFGNVFVNLTMFILIPIAFGLIAAYSEAWLEQRYPDFAFRPITILLYLPAGLGILFLGSFVFTQIRTLRTGTNQSLVSDPNQVWLSLIVLGLLVLLAIFEPQLKRFAYGSQLRLLAVAAPMFIGAFLLFQALSEILQ